VPVLPAPLPPEATAWVTRHLGHLSADPPAASGIPGGQAAADAALAGLDITGYARRRSQLLPLTARGATRLSPYIRHGLLTLPQVWAGAAPAAAGDLRKFRDELLWQEYARHLYARLGPDLGRSLRSQPSAAGTGDPWSREMACMDAVMEELEQDGWVVNQTRMWLASQWTVRGRRDWREGEDLMFRHLLDGSRAANRLGWQWTTGAGSGKPYGFSRWQVEKRAPALCGGCPLRDACPLERWPDETPAPPVTPPARLDGGMTEAGPEIALLTGDPEQVWLTAESLGSTDPALVAHPDLPRVFVFDELLLTRLRLSGKRLVFLTQALAELDCEVLLGDPVTELAGRRLAVTYAPVPGFRRRAAELDVVALHPWPWLRRPTTGSLRSWSAWVRQ
jgi:deoxyribodipyrimidine photo-lyase